MGSRVHQYKRVTDLPLSFWEQKGGTVKGKTEGGGGREDRRQL